MTDSQCEKAMFRGNFRLLEYQSLKKMLIFTIQEHVAKLYATENAN